MNDIPHTEPELLRTQLVEQLIQQGNIRTACVEAAMRAIPRHLFLPGTPVQDAYTDELVITKRDANGIPISSASQPAIVAMMLEQLDIRPGHQVLEIGAGTGYNAALLRELVGNGQVTTIDIDPQVVDGAQRGLSAAGYDDVRVVAADGALGDKTGAPYDRIIVTTGAWDLPAAWWEQMVDGGRLVVPLRWRGQTRSIAFDHQQDRMVSRSVELCGFIPMQGPAGDGERAIQVDDGVVLYCDEDQPIHAETLRGVLDRPKSESWSGVFVEGNETFDGVWLRVASTEPGTCRIAVDETALNRGAAAPAVPSRSVALIEGASLAYFALRPHAVIPGDTRRFELGAIGHAPNGQALADRIVKQVRAWDSNRGSQPIVTAHPVDTPDDQLPEGLTIDKRHTRLTVSW